MARKIILHIGASKTGSSAIQSFMRLNHDYFSENGFFIPDSHLRKSPKISGEHVMVLQELMTDPDKSRVIDAFDFLRDTVSDDQTILISAENLSNLGRHALLEKALEGFDVEVILYIRRQDDLLQSAWQQWHSKIESDFNGWLIKGLRQYGHWDRLINQWESVVGEENVKVRIFERSEMAGGDLLRDFLDCLGLDPMTEEPEFDVGTVNPSYSDLITPLVAGNSNIFKDANDSAFYHMVGRLTGDTYVKQQKVSLMSRQQRESTMFFYRDINQRVCKKSFNGRKQLFAPIDHSKFLYLTEEELTKRQLQFLTHLVFSLARNN